MKGHLKMKLRLLLLVACAMFAGRAMAQSSCSVKPLQFPAVFNSAVCIASGTPGGTQTARLRWDNNDAGELQLFDTDDAGAPMLWCAQDSGGNCVRNGQSLCLQSDGNMVIYAGTNCSGTALWASNTVGANEDGEILVVGELFVNGVSKGESAFIINDNNAGSDTGPQIVWFSNNND
jgi:hypothetical protein